MSIGLLFWNFLVAARKLGLTLPLTRFYYPYKCVDDGRGDSPPFLTIYSPPRPSHMTLPLNPQLPQVNARVLASYSVIDQPDIHTLEDISVLEISSTILPRSMKAEIDALDTYQVPS